MFQPNSRIENLKGLKFYEQDIIYDDYVFSEDIQITLTADYITPGIGIALITNEGLSIKEKSEAYLIRVGYREASIVYKNNDTVKPLAYASTTICPFKENMQLIFTKEGRKLTLSSEEGIIISYEMPARMDKYNFGVYSNAGNTIKDIAIASSIPNDWNVNMRNTSGGYISFSKNGFKVENCKADAEIEQTNIDLEEGTYYLKFDKTKDIENDIVPFIFFHDDKRIYDEEKNLLNEGKFYIPHKTKINIKFKGKYGEIKNINISDKSSDKYVTTRKNQATISGSYIDILLAGVDEIKWTGVIQDVPNEIESKQQELYAIVADSLNSYLMPEIGVELNKEYSYSFMVSNYILSIHEDGKLVKETTIRDINEKLIIFKNINAVITEFILVMDGEEVSLITEKTSKKYVPGSISSPIIAVDKNETPLELSSSYRVTDHNGTDKYLFTNYEREYFKPEQRIRLSKKVSHDAGSIKVYGILNGAKTNMDNFYRIPTAGMDGIQMFCEKYETLYEQDLFHFDKFSGDIYLNDVKEYSMIIVDYLKRDSYCINYKPDMKIFEVDISSSEDETSLIYDNSQPNKSESFYNSSNYKVTNYSPKENCYLVLRRGGF